jgi:hypothetical protein
MKKSVSLENINSIQLSKFSSILQKESISIFLGKPGERPYAFLAYIASQFTNRNIIVTDAWRGLASLALSYEPTNKVHSFTTRNFMDSNIRSIENHRVHENIDLLSKDQFENNRELILESAIIFVDHSPHNGTDEYMLYEFLLANKYRGIVISDHVWVHKQMRDNYWYKIAEKYRYDFTQFASEDGTSAYTFFPDDQPFVLEKVDATNWTLVTAYFNLTKCPDASRKIMERDAAYYMHHAISTLCLPYNLVVYCDEESLPIIREIRPPEFDSRTVYKIRDFELLQFSTCDDVVTDDRTFSQYREKIIQNRVEHPYQFDERNTASYYLFCLSRYLMLIETIDENPFNSTHFCWINFCIERMGYKNLVHLPECLITNREKFSTCYIEYIPDWYIKDTARYYDRGIANMCSGFFTGNAYYMRTTCKYIIEKFLYYLELGYGHADEQLFSPVYFDHPELFDHYYGDYTEMITNYKYVYARPEEPLHILIKNSFDCGDYARCLDGCRFLLRSLGLHKCRLDEKDLNLLRYYFTESSMNLLISE